MKIIFPLIVVILVMFSVDKISRSDNSKRDKMKNMTVSQQIKFVLLSYSPYIIAFVLFLILAFILS